MDAPPDEFDERFVAWLARASDELWIDFGLRKSSTEPDHSKEVEQLLGFRLPLELRMFYAHFCVWGVKQDWSGWKQTQLAILEVIPLHMPLVPIYHQSESPNGIDVVAVVESPDKYEVIRYRQSTRAIRKFDNLRSYFIWEVANEIGGCVE